MIHCRALTVTTPDGKTTLLRGATADFLPGGMNAVIGPSGCGKTTLMKAVLGILPAQGEAFCGGERITCPEDLVGRVGFAPQFSIAQPKLTVEESLRYALELCVSDPGERSRRLETILTVIGLAEHRSKRIESLSGGQLRRIGLGLELTLDPPCLICDEVTSGLDPLSEDQILALMRRLCRERGKTFLCIIHNLAKLDCFDRITVVYEGDVVFQGTLEELCAFFEIPDALHLYDRLNAEELSHWQDKWSAANTAADAAPTPENSPQPAFSTANIPAPARRPGGVGQYLTLLRRRFTLFFRDSGYLWLTLAITFGFPCLVVIFALDGLPQIQGMALERSVSFIEEMRQNIAFKINAMETTSLVTGLIMFQVILLTLMGSNNGAREIAAERTLYEKERLSGLGVIPYALAKITFVLLIAFFQGAWMTFFVKVICRFPGPWLTQFAVLMLVCGSMTLVCLGFSALFKSAEKASLLSIYLVGFQLPLSGVVLALPDSLVWVCRPFINSYWGWAGYLSSMLDTRFWDAFRENNAQWVASPGQAVAVLALQGAVGVALVLWGCSRKQWN
ncbi:ABC transporter ATP-binding protein/permease [Ruficoccus amylovorans]|uniref:ABC transporter ATP-binding protein/permease n=2 Tax=Ruficoccus amylovorans TaxID=1804625 RepID=A0A842HBI3_9BACT|nr:ATP-binding cassette domain-containing protein [Ruficoccus amylovorans]MBC2592987.1 ABC transporter ATP-binding protein/permease [Ruficoccus amylovorans]